MLAALVIGIILQSDTSYPTIYQAAVAGLKQSAVLTTDYEAGGEIYEKDGRFYTTIPFTDNLKVAIQLKEYAPSPKGYTLIGDFHTHVCGPHIISDQFSPSDVLRNKYFKTVGFIADLCTGNVHEFDPSQPGEKKNEGQPFFATPGHIVGWIG